MSAEMGNQYTGYQLDKSTGFLVGNRMDAITADTKLKFLELYAENGNITQSARIMGIEPKSIRIHMNVDDKFRAEIEEARERICDKAEGHIVEHMGNQKNTIDRLAWLRSYRPKIWNPQPNINGGTVNIQINGVDNARQIVEGKRLNVEGGTGVQSAVRSDGSSNVVDTTASPLTPVNNANQAVSPDNPDSSVKSPAPSSFSPMPPPSASAWDNHNSEKIKRAPENADPNHIPPPSNRSRASRIELDPD